MDYDRAGFRAGSVQGMAGNAEANGAVGMEGIVIVVMGGFRKARKHGQHQHYNQC